MDLQHVDVCTESFHAGINRVEDVFSRQAGSVHKISIILASLCNRQLLSRIINAKVAFREDDDSAAGNIELLQSLTDDLLATPIAIYIGLGSSLKRLHVPITDSKNTYSIPRVEAHLYERSLVSGRTRMTPL